MRLPPLIVYVHPANQDLNKTPMQKYMAGAWLYSRLEGREDEFVLICRRKGVKEVVIVEEMEETNPDPTKSVVKRKESDYK